MLSSQNGRNLAGQSAERLAFGIYDIPLSLHFRRLSYKCLHVSNSSLVDWGLGKLITISHFIDITTECQDVSQHHHLLMMVNDHMVFALRDKYHQIIVSRDIDHASLLRVS